MTASEMAKKANENRRKALGQAGYARYMQSLSKKAIAMRGVNKVKDSEKDQ